MGGAAVVCLLGGVSFPVIFVLFRFAPELSIFPGIVRFNCVVLLAYRGRCSRFRFSSLGLSTLLVPCLLWQCHRWMSSATSSVSAVCLLTPRRCPSSSSLRPSLFALHRLVVSLRLACRGTGSQRGCYLPHDVVAGGMGVGVVMLWMWSGAVASCRASAVPFALLLRIGWRRDGTCGFLGWGCGWRVMRCLLDVVRAADEMMRCSCPCVPSSFFSFRPAPPPRLFPICLLDLIPRPPGRGRRGRMSICGCGRWVGLLACHLSVPLSRYRSFAILVGLRSGSLLVCGHLLRFVCGCVVVSVAVSSRIRYRMM